MNDPSASFIEAKVLLQFCRQFPAPGDLPEHIGGLRSVQFAVGQCRQTLAKLRFAHLVCHQNG